MPQNSSIPLFVSLDPDPTLDALVRQYKKRVHRLAGEQLYLTDPPHITAYLAHFASPNAVLDAAAQLAEEISAVELSIIGWHVFAEDPLTGRHTLVLQMNEAAQNRLRSVQHRVIEAVAPLRDLAGTEGRYRRSIAALSQRRQNSIVEFGFPFTGLDWHPHLSVASIQPADWPAVDSELLAEKPQADGSVERLTVFRLEGIEPAALASFALRPCEVHA